MTTISFGGGEALKVSDDPSTVIQRIQSVQNGDRVPLGVTGAAGTAIQGWINVNTVDGTTVAVQASSIAYVGP